jgi:hypothetical protein
MISISHTSRCVFEEMISIRHTSRCVFALKFPLCLEFCKHLIKTHTVALNNVTRDDLTQDHHVISKEVGTSE